MRGKNIIVSSLLCALLVLTFALSAQANVTYQVQTSPLNAVKNGVAEVMGDVSLTVNASPVDTGIAVNDQITITYSGAAIANTYTGVIATGIVVSGAGANFAPYFAAPANFAITVTPNVASIGGTVSIRFLTAIPAGTLVPGADTVTVTGVRASVVGRAISNIVITQFTAAPGGSSSFIVTSAPTVAFVVDNFSISGSGLARVPICSPSGTYTFKVKEESLTTWVQYVDTPSTVTPLTGRSTTKFGANANSQVHLVVGGLPSGVKITWPTAVTSDLTTSFLQIVSQSTSGDDALYQFATADQAVSDNAVESFTFSFTFGVNITVGLSTPPNSATTLTAQMYPNNTVTTVMPRFSDPVRDPALDFAIYVDCVTNLLFPWVGSLPDFGYDTGIAIANTGYDVGAITPPTVGDDGVIRFYFYPQTFGAAPVAPTPVTTSVIRPGDTYATPFSAFGASKFGYMIAVCEFRFGHGFAYITQGTIGGTLDTAQGYLALVLDTGASGSGRTFVESLGE